MPVLLSDLLQDTDDVLLQNHTGGLTWSKQGSRDLKFSSNTLIKSASGGQVFYRVVEDPGTRLVRVTGFVNTLNSSFQSAIGGVSACHDAVDGLAGYYFGVRSDEPEGGVQGAVRLFGWDENGDDLFVEQEAEYDSALSGTDMELALVITPTHVRGYVNDELKVSIEDASLAGTLVGLIGGWSHNDGEVKYLKGPFTVETSGDGEEPEEPVVCFPENSTPIADPDPVTMVCAEDPAVAVMSCVKPAWRIVPDDSCIPVGTLVSTGWILGDGQLIGDDLVIGG